MYTIGQKLNAGSQKIGQKLNGNSQTFGQKTSTKITKNTGSMPSSINYQNSYIPVKGDQPSFQHGKYSALEKTRQRKHYA